MSGRPVELDMLIFHLTETLVHACQRAEFTRERARTSMLTHTFEEYREARAAVFDMLWPVEGD